MILSKKNKELETLRTPQQKGDWLKPQNDMTASISPGNNINDANNNKGDR
jgi:hypothetical protein